MNSDYKRRECTRLRSVECVNTGSKSACNNSGKRRHNLYVTCDFQTRFSCKLQNIHILKKFYITLSHCTISAVAFLTPTKFGFLLIMWRIGKLKYNF
jgi:hypothetical protein